MIVKDKQDFVNIAGKNLVNEYMIIKGGVTIRNCYTPFNYSNTHYLFVAM